MSKHDELIEQGYKTYESDEITVYWNPNICIHAGECVKNSPEVFQLKRRPWVDLSFENGEKTAQTIDKCPSKALQYILKK